MVASNLEKSGQLDNFSRSVKSQGILQNGLGNFKCQESLGKVSEFYDFGLAVASLFVHVKRCKTTIFFSLASLTRYY